MNESVCDSEVKVARLHKAIFGKNFAFGLQKKDQSLHVSEKPVKSYEEVRICLPAYEKPIVPSISPDTVVANHVKGNFSHTQLPHFKVHLKKHSDSSYGIFLRRGLLVHRFHLTNDGFILENRSEVLLTDYGVQNSSCGLLPGDYLVAVGDKPVGSISRNEVVHLIRSTDLYLSLTVQSLPEFTDFFYRLVLVPQSALENLKIEQEYVHDNFYHITPVSVRGYAVKYGSFKNLYLYLQKVKPDTFENSSVDTVHTIERKPNDNNNDNEYVQSVYHEDNNQTDFPVWITFKQGYVSGKFLGSLPNGRCRVIILPGQEVIEVNSEDVERANPPRFDRVDDLIKLRYINESSVTHSFIQRYGSGLIFTYASGINLISINPMMPLNIYSDKVMDLFTNCQVRYDMPPHVYSVAQLILARLKRRLFYSIVNMEQQQNHMNGNPVYHLPCSISQQVLCLLGRSGSGKTHISNDVFTYMIYQSEKSINHFNHSNNDGNNSIISNKINECRLRALFNMLDSFTCSRIILNTNGSRALRLFSLEFANIHSLPIVNQPEDISLIVTGLTTRLLLFERSRVTDRPEGEPNFHIFYYMLAGLDEGSRRELFLTDLDVPNLFMTRLHRPEDKISAKKFWQQLCHDAELLQFDIKNEWLTGGITRLLAVIYHLGCAGYCNEINEENLLYFTNYQSAQYAAYLLHCSLDTLNELIFNPVLRKPTTNHHHHHLNENNNDNQNCIKWTAKYCLHAFVQDLYNMIVDILISLINRCLSTSKSDLSSQFNVAAQLILVDPVGFQIPYSTTSLISSSTSVSSPTAKLSSESNEMHKTGNFTDLIFNYAYECFNQLYFDSNILLDEQRLKHDGLTSPIPYENFCRTKNILNFMDNTTLSTTPNSFPYKNLTTTNNDVYNNTVFPGLFCLLDSVAQNGDFSQLYDTLSQMYQTQRKLYENRDLRSIRRFKRNGSSFVLNHNLSTTPIEYAPNWSWFTPYHRSSASLKKLINFLEQSSVASLRMIVSLLKYKEDYLSSFLPNSSSHIGVYSEVKSIMDTLTRSLYDCAAHNASYNPNDPGSGFNDGGPPSGMHWIHCFLPVSTAGLCELNEEIPINQLMQINYPSNDRLTNDDNHINNNDINHNTSNSFLFELMKRYPNKNLVLSPARICVNLIRAQIRGIELINTLQAVKQSYPDRLSLKEFCNRFVSLLPNSSKIRELKQNESLNKSIVHEILNSLHYSPETFQLGSNNIYLRTFIIPQLIHRLSYSPELSIDQELIHVQPDCKSYIIDCSNEQQVIITEDKINPHIVQKYTNAKEHAYNIEINEKQINASPSVESNKNNTVYEIGSVPILKVDNDSTIHCEKSETLKSTMMKSEELEPTNKEHVNSQSATMIDKEVTLSKRGKCSISISRDTDPNQTYKCGSIILVGSSETIKPNPEDNNVEAENNSMIVNKEIRLVNPTSHNSSSLNMSTEVEPKPNTQPITITYDSIGNDLNVELKDMNKQVKPRKSTLHSSFFTDNESEKQIVIQTNRSTPSFDTPESHQNSQQKVQTNLLSQEVCPGQFQSNSLLNNKTGGILQNDINKPVTPDMPSITQLAIKLENDNQLNHSDSELIKIKLEYSKALERIKELEAMSNDLKCKLSALTIENAHYKQNCDRARSDLELAEENRIQAEQQTKVINLKLEQAEKRHLLLLESLKNASGQDIHNNTTAEYTILYPDAPEPLLTELNQLRSANQLLTLQLTDLQNTIGDLKKDLETAYANHQKAEKTIEKLRIDITRIQDEYEADYEANRTANQVKLRQLEEAMHIVQEENTRLTRDKHQLELEVSTLNLELSNASNDGDIEHKLRKELKIIKSLLAEKEALIIELSSNPSDSQSQIKKLRDRVDELDELNEILNRQKRALQSDLDEIQQQLASALRTQKEFEEDLFRSKRQLLDLQNQFTDQEEAHKETRDKLQNATASLTIKEATIQAQIQEIDEFLIERKKMQTQIDELKLKLNTNNIDQVPRSELERLEAKIREFEQRLDIETSNRVRIQYSLDRAKETIDQLTNERDKLIIIEANEREQNRKLSRQLREAQQDENEATRRATTAQRRAEEAQMDANKAMHEALCSRAEMNALLRRTQDLEALVKSKQNDSDYEDLLNCNSSGEDLILNKFTKGSQDFLLRSNSKYRNRLLRGSHQLRLLNRAFSDDNLPYFPNRLSDHLSTTIKNGQSSYYKSSIDNKNFENSKEYSTKDKPDNSILLPQARSVSPFVSLSKNNHNFTGNNCLYTNKLISSEDRFFNASNYTSMNSFETTNTCDHNIDSTNNNDSNNSNDQTCNKPNGSLIFSSNIRVLTSPKFKQTVTIQRVQSDHICKPNMDVVSIADSINSINNNDKLPAIPYNNHSSIDSQNNDINDNIPTTTTITITSSEVTARNESPSVLLSSTESFRNLDHLHKTNLEIHYHGE
uniref:Myosin motor domain-containing protein n=1 Tax=Schistosoma mansoni TaxID=6183 RepID=A0A5K4FD58_SCHMA